VLLARVVEVVQATLSIMSLLNVLRQERVLELELSRSPWVTVQVRVAAMECSLRAGTLLASGPATAFAPAFALIWAHRQSVRMIMVRLYKIGFIARIVSRIEFCRIPEPTQRAGYLRQLIS
jgi:hypothetical protein